MITKKTKANPISKKEPTYTAAEWSAISKANMYKKQTKTSAKRYSKQDLSGDVIKEQAAMVDDLREDIETYAAAINKLALNNISSLNKQIILEKKLLEIAARKKKISSPASYAAYLKLQKRDISQLHQKMDNEGELIEYARENIKLLDKTIKKQLEALETKILSQTITDEELKNYTQLLLKSGKYLEAQSKLKEIQEEMLSDSPYVKVRDYMKSLAKHSDEIRKNFKVASAILVGTLTAKLGESVAMAAELKKEMGLTGSQTMDVAFAYQKAAINAMFLGISTKSLKEATGAILQQTKSTNNLTAGQIKSVGILIDRYGLAADEAALLHNNIMRASKEDEKMTDSIIDYAINLAESAKVPIGPIMKEVAADTTLFAASAKKGGKNLFEAAVFAAQMESSLSEVSKLSTGLLDIESSLAGQMKISAMFGANINFDKARQLAYNDDIVGSTNEILRQLKEELNWTELTGYERKIVADAMGTEVDSLNGMMVNYEKTLAIKKNEETTWGRIYNIGSRTIKVAKDYGMSLAAAVNWTGSLLRNWKQIGSTIKPVLDWTKKIAAVGLEKIKGIVGLLPKKEIAGGIGEQAVDVMKDGLKDKVGDITDKTKELTEVSEKVPKENPIAGFLKGFDSVPWSSIAKAAVVILALGASMIPFAYGISLMEGVDWKTIAAGTLAMISMAAAATILGNPATVGFLQAGALGLLMIGGAMLAFGGGVKLLADGIVVLTPMMSELLPLIGQLALLSGGMFAIGAGFAAMGTGLLPLAAGLALVAPFLPVLEALGNIENKQIESTSTKNESNSILVEKMDKVISLLEKGGNIYLDGRQIAKWLGTTTSAISVIENRK